MIKPLNDLVLLEVEEVESKTASGIILTETKKEKSTIGRVIAVGQGRVVDGKVTPLTVKENDRVIFDQYGGSTIKYDNKEYLIISESKLLAVIE